MGPVPHIALCDALPLALGVKLSDVGGHRTDLQLRSFKRCEGR